MISLSPPRLAFLAVGGFSRALAFRLDYYPRRKMGTTRSLPVGKNAGVAKQISLSLKYSNARDIFAFISRTFAVGIIL